MSENKSQKKLTFEEAVAYAKDKKEEKMKQYLSKALDLVQDALVQGYERVNLTVIKLAMCPDGDITPFESFVDDVLGPKLTEYGVNWEPDSQLGTRSEFILVSV